MLSDRAPQSGPGLALAPLLALLSIVLLVVYLAAVLSTALPPQFVDPPWQLALVAVLINNASLALVGALLLPLALAFDPGNHRLRIRWNAFRRWALAASLGFLLLIPLQGYAAWRFHTTLTVAREQQASLSGQKLTELRRAIGTATTHQELQATLQKLFGRNAGLSPAELRTPMDELRPMLLARAEQASNQLMQQVEAQAARKPDQMVRESLRIAVSALAYAACFSFLAGVLPRGQAAGGLQRVVDEDYFEKLAD
jgi:hypothetical protein